MTDPLDHPVVAACEAAAHALVVTGVSQPSDVMLAVRNVMDAWPEPVPEATCRALTEGPLMVLLVEEVIARAALTRCARHWLDAGQQEAPGGDISLTGPLATVAAELFLHLGALAGHAVEMAYCQPVCGSGLQPIRWRDLTPSELATFDGELLRRITAHLMEDN